MTSKCALVLLLAVPSWGQSVTQALEKRYNSFKSLKVDFEETVSYGGRTRRHEAGTLYLLRPGKMRWDYTRPAGKLFVSDGETFYLYSPNANQVQRIKPRHADDWRAPLAFLLGRLDFSRDFQKFVTRPAGDLLEVTAYPRRERDPFTHVVFLVEPNTYEIRRIAIHGQDGLVTEFAFRNETANPRLEDRLFRFQAPPGAEIVEVSP